MASPLGSYPGGRGFDSRPRSQSLCRRESMDPTEIKVPPGVELVNNWNNIPDAAYRISCQCGCDSHITFHTDFPHSIDIAMTAYRRSWYEGSKIKGLWVRIREAWNMLVHGEVSAHADIIIDSPEKMNNLSYLLQQLSRQFEDERNKEATKNEQARLTALREQRNEP